MQQKILRIDASARHAGSYSRALTDLLVKAYPGAHIRERDIYKDVQLLSESLIETATPLQEILIDELLSTDILVLGVPVYNFGIPAALKCYIDLVVRARRTFRYGAGGPEGLVKNLHVIVAVTSNGTALGGPDDFVTSYLKCIFSFIGVRDIQFIDATQLLLKGEAAVMAAAQQKVQKYSAANFEHMHYIDGVDIYYAEAGDRKNPA